VSSANEQSNDCSCSPAVSADGRFVLFGSYATNLLAGDGNGQPDVFLRDRVLGLTTRVSVASDGSERVDRSWPGAVSVDGDRVAFSSFAKNVDPRDAADFANVYWCDLTTGMTAPAFLARSGALPDESVRFACADPDLTAIEMRGGLLRSDGAFVVLPVVLPVALPVALPVSGGAPLDADLDSDPSLIGLSIIAQRAQFDVMTPRGMALTEGIELVLGR